MGLDAWVYVADDEASEYDQWDQLAYFRKHPNLHGWMRELWRNKHKGSEMEDGMFNGVPVELTREDIDRLERDVISGYMGKLNTVGFFFGNASDDYYREHVLRLCDEARFRLFMKQRVFYNSGW